MPEPLTLPPGSIVDFGELSSMISIMDRLKERDDADKVQAIRYQGQQDYSQMVAAQMDPMEAMLKAAPKLFHQNPAGLAQVVEAKQRMNAAQQHQALMGIPAEVVTLDNEKYIKRPTADGGSTLIHVPRPAPPRPPPTDPFLNAEIMAARSRITKAHDALLANPKDQAVIDEDFEAKNAFLALKKSVRKPLASPSLSSPMPMPGDGQGIAPPVPAAPPQVSRVWDSKTKSWRK